MNRSNPLLDYGKISFELINLAQKRNPADREKVIELLSLLNKKDSEKGLQGNEFEAVEAGKSFLRMVPEEDAN